MTYYVMGVGGGVQNPLLPTSKKLFFFMKSGRKKRERDVYIFYIVDTCEAVQKHWSWHYLYWTVGGGGGRG